MTQAITADVCVIGAGPAGLAAATTAAHLGARVVLVEKGRFGGNNLHTGAVPAQAVIAVARRIRDIQSARHFGIRVSEPVVDFVALAASIGETIGALAVNHSPERLGGLGVDVVKGEAQFTDKRTLMVGDTVIEAKKFVIATGSKSHVPAILGLDRAPIFLPEAVLENLGRLQRLLVLGASGVGLALAQAYRRFGSQVTVMDSGKALPNDDPELRDVLFKALERDGITLLENARIERMEPFGDNTRVVFVMDSKSYAIEATNILLAVGREPAIGKLNLDAAGVTFNMTGIIVDKHLRTANKDIYAAGDVTGLMPLAHVADFQGEAAVRHALLGEICPLDLGAMPWVSFTDPELAHVGLSENEARQKYGALTILRWPYAENERARIEKQTLGFMKAFGAKGGKILGANAVGAEASEIIQVWSLAIQKGIGLGDMRQIVCPFPTLGDVNRRTALSDSGPIEPSSIYRSFKGLLANLR